MDASEQETRNQEKSDELRMIMLAALSQKGDKKCQHNIILFIKRTLEQFNISSLYPEEEIFIEAYFRTYQRIEKGEYINNMSAWLKKVSVNIIREAIKEEGRTLRVARKVFYSKDKTELFLTKQACDDSNSDDIEILLEALEELEPKTFEILNLRIIQELSWRDIYYHLYPTKLTDQDEQKAINKIRKSGNRGLALLRKIFFSKKQVQLLQKGGLEK